MDMKLELVIIPVAVAYLSGYAPGGTPASTTLIAPSSLFWKVS